MLSAYLLASLVLTILGIVFFVYGKRVANLWIGVGGIALLLAPYVMFAAWELWLLAAAVCAGTVASRLFLGRGPMSAAASQ